MNSLRMMVILISIIIKKVIKTRGRRRWGMSGSEKSETEVEKDVAVRVVLVVYISQEEK